MNISDFESARPTSAAEAIERATSIIQSVGADETQIAIWLLRQHRKFDVVHASVYDDACELVEYLITQPKQLQKSSTTPLPATPATLTATQIGQMLAARATDLAYSPSAQQINQALKQLNLQTRDSKKIWHLTELGQQYGRIISVTDDRERTRLQVRWLPTVLDRLAPLFSVSC